MTFFRFWEGLVTASTSAKTKFLFIALAILAVYSYGWKLTEINLGELFRDFHLVKPLVTELA